MTPQTLRESIYRRAFEGRLVERRPKEGTAEDTLSCIKYQNVNSVDECPDIPENWRWTYLIDMADILYGFPFNSEKFNEACIGMPIIRIRDINNGYSKTFSDEPCEERYRITEGDMLVGMDGNFQVAFWKSEDAWLNQRVCKITSNPQVLVQKYLYYYLPIILKEINGTVSFSTVKHLSAKILNKMLIPLPPLAEQKRIVAKIEELLHLIDRYELAWSKLEDFNKRFPADMQKSILQMAIQGKLVPQLPEEGTGEELFQQIQTEKQQQIKCGALRKTKALPEITEDQLPGTFPDSWKICYIDDIAFVTKLAGFEYSSVIASNLSTSGIPLFKGKNVQNGKLVLEFESYIPEKVSDELPRSQILKRCLLTPYVGTIGNIAIFDGSFKAHLGSNVGKIELLNGEEQYVLEEYVLYYLRSDIGYRELTKYKKATAQESISIDAIRNVIIAIPPLAEQKRIVAKLEEILPLCERLK